MGWLTLLVFPIPAFIVLYFFEDYTISQFFDLENLSFSSISLGLLIGTFYAIVASKILSFRVFEEVPLKIDDFVRDLKLSTFTSLFLSICAGVGEELLFRMGVQYYLGPLITAILFVAVHGYIHPLNWKKSLYGFVVLPLSLILCYGFEIFGLWFSIAVHFTYDAILFLEFSKKKSPYD